MRLAFLGTPEFSVVSLAAIVAAGYEVACVYSQPPAPRGRGKKLTPSPVQAFAEERGIEVRTPASMRAPEEITAFEALGLDAAVVVAFGQILPREVLEAPRLGAFNLHASLLPRWRGAAPIQRAIMAGDKATGVAVMRMTEGLDEGPTLAVERVRIDALETAGTLHDRLAEVGARLLVATLPDIAAGTAVETPQPTEGVTYARKIRPRETKIDWRKPASEVDRQIRGLAPFPGAWFMAEGERGPVRVKALLSTVEEGDGAPDHEEEPGELLDDRLLIACGAGAVRILAAQREGRGAQGLDEFVRGFRLAKIVA
jgi:methionyl-tRNA formyltransferase